MQIRAVGTNTALLMMVCGLAAADARPRTPQQIVQHHFAAAAARDLDALVSDYADDATLITANGSVQGRQAVRAAFAQLLRPPQPGARPAESGATRSAPQIVVSHYSDNIAWLIWVQNAGKSNEVRGVETYLVRDGRIELETVGTVAVRPAGSAMPKQ